MTEIHKAALFLHVKIYHSCPMNMQKNKYVFKNFDTLNRNSTNRHDEDLLKLRREKIFFITVSKNHTPCVKLLDSHLKLA